MLLNCNEVICLYNINLQIISKRYFTSNGECVTPFNHLSVKDFVMGTQPRCLLVYFFIINNDL